METFENAFWIRPEFYSGIKTCKFTSYFPNRKSFWHVKSKKYPLRKCSVQAWRCAEQGFYDVTRAQYD